MDIYCKACGAPIELHRETCPYCGCIYPHIQDNYVRKFNIPIEVIATATPQVLHSSSTTYAVGGKGNSSVFWF